MENSTPAPQTRPRSSFSLTHLAIVALLALGAGAGTAWLLTDGGSIRTAIRPRDVEPAPRIEAAPRTPPVIAPVLAAPDGQAVTQPAPVARRDLTLAPAAAPIPVPAQRGTTGSSAVQLDYGDNERALAPAIPTQVAPGAATQDAAQGPARVGDCERYTTEIIIDGRRTQRTGMACLQADGTWRIQGDH